MLIHGFLHACAALLGWMRHGGNLVGGCGLLANLLGQHKGMNRMKMERNALLYAFRINQIPAYICPHCRGGRLKLEGEFESEETEESKKDQEQGWDPDLVVLRFSCKLKCPICLEIVFLIGSGGVEREHEVDDNGEWNALDVTYFDPKFFYPALSIANCPDRTPYRVKEQVDAAGALYFSHPDSCCNSIRAAAEEILTDLGVDVLDDKGGFISFAKRIQGLPSERESVVALFHAIRWLGNYGSHPGSGLQRSHALDAFDILDLLLEELYSDRKLKTQELAKRINDAKGPFGHLRAAVTE
ncbi:DUF4145 domain-containing protein [Pseudomonas sp.]|uniref:DUF4145 domain-containing protein n=1 Tax=Pseudomonas sp. TaxID=306 RepID=UPI003D6EAEEE